MNALLTRQERDISAALDVCVWQCRSSEVGQLYTGYMEGGRHTDVFPQTVDTACDAKKRASALRIGTCITWVLQKWTGRRNVSASSVRATTAYTTQAILQTHLHRIADMSHMYNRQC